ncbi:carbohydrate ABC transporter permease [Aquipuribacter sp. SD81]|uniref:carbohydrate ABC transporter permease n=1 Tax=Aquipuribacter sp. SD81 TaxID=3127703 RepID=UPI0030168877
MTTPTAALLPQGPRGPQVRPTGRRGVLRPTARRAEAVAGALLAAPATLVFVVFMFVPLALTLWFSLHEWGGFGPMTWVGGENYTEIAGDPVFWKAFGNTIVFTVLTVPLGMALGLLAAVLLNRALPARGLLRALVYVPVVVSGVAAGVIFLRLFDPIRGVVNQVAGTLGLPQVDWQSSGTAALASVVVVVTWQGVGFAMVVYLAALQGVPREVYEAAAVDGAGPGRTFRSITWPLLAPTTWFLVVYSVILSFQAFDVVYVLTRGGPGTSTTFLVQYAYDQGFTQLRQGYAAALGVIIYVVVLALTVVQWRVSRRGGDA